METLEPELSKEPRHALTDEGDGLSIIREMIHIYPMFLTPGGIFAVEHGSAQGEAVRRLFFEAGHVSTTLRDLCGNERVTYMQAGE
jgi:release factor glutamine methyltransferase